MIGSSRVGGDAFVFALRHCEQAPQHPLWLCGMTQGEAFLLRHLAQTLIRTDEVIAPPPAVEIEGHGALESIQGVSLVNTG